MAPSKAQVVDVSGRRLSGVSVKVPPRSSSLMGTHPVPINPDFSNRSWMNLDEAPNTPEFWERYHMAGELEISPTDGFQPAPPARRLEMEMLSPPTSPNQYQYHCPDSGEVSPGIFPFSPESHGSGGCQTASKLAPHSTADILAALEDSASDFPNTTLMHDTPCVLSLRDLLQKSTFSHSQTPTRQLLPPFDYDAQYFLQNNDQQKRRVTFSSSKPARFISSPPYLPKPRTTNAAPNPCPFTQQVVPPDPPAFQALRRIFPSASRSISTLYAYIIAYIFTCSLQPGVETSAFASLYENSSLHRPPSTASSKAANMLGISFAPTPEENNIFPYRALMLAEELKVCICRLVQVMRNAPDGTEYLDAEFLRSLVEVVRAYEIQPC